MLKKISVKQLAVGMYLKEFSGSWMEHPFWRNSFVITDPRDIERVRASSIREVWIDCTKGIDVPPDEPAISEAESESQVEAELADAAQVVRETAPVSTSEELARAAKDSEISLHAKMGAVCDVYDAISSGRPYKAPWDPAESIHKMAEWAGGQFDQVVFHAFVKSIGIYPVGALVRLKSGRLGVVVGQSAKSLLTPRVKAFFSTRANARITPEIVDLAAPDCDEVSEAREDPAKWDFPDLVELWPGLSGKAW